MAPASCDHDNQHPSLVEKLNAVGKPCFAVFEERRLAGVPPPEMDSASDSLAIPGDPEDLTAIKLLPEDGGSAAWLVANVRCADDIVMARIPAWAGDGATSCIFPRQVQTSWPKSEYKPIDRSEASCLRITDVRGKGKGCVVAHGVPRGELVARERALLMLPRTFVTPQQTANALANSLSPKQRATFSAQFVPGPRCGFPPYTMLQCFSGEIRALRPISEGEEVSIAYFQEILEPGTVTFARQKYLQEAYKFKCTCPICSRPSKARARSDEDRPVITVSVVDIGTYYREMVYDWITRGGNDHARLLNYLHTIEAALDREMIFYPAHWIYLARVIVMVRCALREGKAARKWAQRAAQHSRAFIGSDGGWDAIAREPEKCGWWGAWNKPRLRGIWV